MSRPWMALPWLEPPFTLTLELARATTPDWALAETVSLSSVTWAPLLATMPLAPPEMVRPERETRCAPLMVMASLPAPLMEAAPTALSCRPLAVMVTGPVQAPLMLRMVLGMELAATMARESPRVQLILRVARNWLNAGAARVRVSAEIAMARLRIIGLLVGESEKPNAAGRDSTVSLRVCSRMFLAAEWAVRFLSCRYTRHYATRTCMPIKIFIMRSRG